VLEILISFLPVLGSEDSIGNATIHEFSFSQMYVVIFKDFHFTADWMLLCIQLLHFDPAIGPFDAASHSP
jgi:hypothetical protein